MYNCFITYFYCLFISCVFCLIAVAYDWYVYDIKKVSKGEQRMIFFHLFGLIFLITIPYYLFVEFTDYMKRNFFTVENKGEDECT